MIKKILLTLLIAVFAVSCAPVRSAPTVSPRPTVDVNTLFNTPEPTDGIDQATNDLAVATIKANLSIANDPSCSESDPASAAGIEADLVCVFTDPLITVTITKFATLADMNVWLATDLANEKLELQDTWHFEGNPVDLGRIYGFVQNGLSANIAWTLDDQFIYAVAESTGSKDVDLLLEWWGTTGSNKPGSELPNYKEAINTIESNLKIANNQNCVYEKPDSRLGYDARFLCMVTYYVGSGSLQVGVDIYKFATPEKLESFIASEINNETLSLNDYWNYAGDNFNSGRIFGFTENNRTATLVWTIDGALIYARSSTKDVNNPDLLLNWWKEFGSAKN